MIWNSSIIRTNIDELFCRSDCNNIIDFIKSVDLYDKL